LVTSLDFVYLLMILITYLVPVVVTDQLLGGLV